MSLSSIKHKISKLSPQFDLKSLRILGSGADSIAYLANEEYVFRFPKATAAQKTLATEIKLLPQLADSLPVRIPNFKHVGKEGDNLIYIAYPLLLGIPLEKNIFDNLNVSKQEQALQDIALFMQNLHAFPLKVAKNCGVHEELYNGAYRPEQKQLLEQIRHLLAKEEIARIEAIFVSYENDAANFSNSPTLLHADLKPEHILHNPETGHINGIIDWGDICIGDPDYDFTCLHIFYDLKFVMRLLKYFPAKNRGHILAKIQFFIMIRWLQDIVLWAKQGDEKFVNFCLAKLRKHLQDGTY